MAQVCISTSPEAGTHVIIYQEIEDQGVKRLVPVKEWRGENVVPTHIHLNDDAGTVLWISNGEIREEVA